jgi:hypothetical protein
LSSRAYKPSSRSMSAIIRACAAVAAKIVPYSVATAPT